MSLLEGKKKVLPDEINEEWSAEDKSSFVEDTNNIMAYLCNCRDKGKAPVTCRSRLRERLGECNVKKYGVSPCVAQAKTIDACLENMSTQ